MSTVVGVSRDSIVSARGSRKRTDRPSLCTWAKTGGAAGAASASKASPS